MSQIENGSVRLEWDGEIATIVIENQQTLNAMTREMWHELLQCVREVADAGHARALILRGATDNFCSGVDIHELEKTLFAGTTFGALVSEAEQALAELRVPTLAAIDGFCVGGGWQLASACDIRLATPRARFGVTPAKLGITLPVGSVGRLVQIVGSSIAKRLLFTAEVVDVEQALRWGMVTDVLPAESLFTAVRELAWKISQLSEFSLESAKRSINGYACSHPEGIRQETFWSEQILQAGHYAEGANAFLESRAPRFVKFSSSG